MQTKAYQNYLGISCIKYGFEPIWKSGTDYFLVTKKLSSRVDKIIANSNASIDFHKENGFGSQSKSVVIPNGVDTDKFQRDETKREEFRKI